MTDHRAALTLPPGVVVSAPSSRSGKTTVTLGLARALRNRGLKVQAFKCGPDYIDPAFHAAATGRPSYNLDSWAMTSQQIASIARHAAGADIVVAEGAMGLFDGVAAPGQYGTGTSADISAVLGWPVLLVLDASGQAQTAAAIAQGLATYRPGVEVTGVILNRIASPRHETLVRAGFGTNAIPVLGALPRREDLSLPERHLGLVQAEENSQLEKILQTTASHVAGHIDLDAVIAAARRSAMPEVAQTSSPVMPPPGNRIALARDTAFSFVYPHLIENWRGAGAEILPFSPLADEAPDPDADVCWLPGGYPELHAGRLSQAENFRSGLCEFAKTRPVHGECGGYMALGQAIVDAEGTSHPMTGLLGLVTSFARRRLHLGYRRCRLATSMPGFAKGDTLLGHEFHYATILEQPDPPLAEAQDASGSPVPETGSRRGNVSGTFFHMISKAAK